ncbi:hypothetical protein NIHE141904_37820 [Enterobacter hormaechei]|nr:hypothetical protein NIHE141904_37820 [Enterobacter hormaechei]
MYPSWEVNVNIKFYEGIRYHVIYSVFLFLTRTSELSYDTFCKNIVVINTVVSAFLKVSAFTQIPVPTKDCRFLKNTMRNRLIGDS